MCGAERVRLSCQKVPASQGRAASFLYRAACGGCRVVDGLLGWGKGEPWVSVARKKKDKKMRGEAMQGLVQRGRGAGNRCSVLLIATGVWCHRSRGPVRRV
ncbi:hypothetical protein JZ751_027511 [Albula glossodonta]|uniref:Uncharacterized protein n=1 Tax=Albula glossodonta TaxID=121402 RepID=A0A8T2NEW8_9TELE|nr:hypothetical protein JZ751_027511 [Albula glossodonta]